MRNAACAIWISSLFAAAAHGAVVGEIVRIGYPSVGGVYEGRDLVRGGAWVPVVVDLSVEGAGSFDGWIRIAQPDRDGDLCFDTQKVQLVSDAGGRRYTLYVLANPQADRSSAFSVEIRNSENRRIAVMSRGRSVDVLTPVQPPEMLTARHFLVLSVSDRTAGKIALLQEADLRERFSRSVRVAHIAPGDLPNRWLGLDVVDAIVWDEADPTSLTPAQLGALLEWARQGGLLVVAAGRTADAVSGSRALASALPVEIGSIETAARFRRLRRSYLDLDTGKGEEFSTPITVAACKTREGADTVLTEVFNPGDEPSPIITRWRVGRGRMVFVAASIQDLFSDGGRVDKLFKRILEMRDVDESAGIGQEIRLMERIDNWTGFSQVGALYLGSAMIFATLYVLVVTVGSWQFLRRRDWLEHSWSVFAGLALVANVVTVIGVQAIRGGIGKRMAQMSIVDSEAGSSDAYATSYFGLKTSMFGELDLWAPDDYPQVTHPSLSRCFIKPLPSTDASVSDATYADPGRYQLAPSRAELIRVPIRGTVKQFEARWSGMMPGRLDASLSVTRDPAERYDVRITPESVITNHLGVDLHQAFLVYAAQDIYIAGGAADIMRRADKMYIFPLGAMADGATVRPRGAFYEDVFGDSLEFEDWSDDHALDQFLEDAAESFKTISLQELKGGASNLADLEGHEITLVLASLLEEYKPPPPGGAFGRSFGLSFVADGVRHLDWSHFVDTHNALFIGFSRSPGPVRLCTRTGTDEYQAVIPDQALTLYRVVIPLARR